MGDIGNSVPMFWSFFSPDKTNELVKSAGFEIIFARSVEIQTKSGDETHHWILAKVE